jgi:Lon protease-like protein
MSDSLLSLPDDFDGTVRLFPLPNLVLFPRLAQPLHIFEPRYRQMTAEALATDRLIAMALLTQADEPSTIGPPSIHPTVCIGRILQDQKLEDGRYNLLLHGLARARVIEEVPTDKLYRTARVALVEEVPPAGDEEEGLRRRLAERASPFFAYHPGASGQLQQLIESPISLGGLCDIFAFALPVDVQGKQRLLDEGDVTSRVLMLLTMLEGAQPPTPPVSRRFPPTICDN